ncbi:DUF1033 family protein [Salinicoccus sp. ID82-1]|uniref:DUF1033 family protein n=1 Tax=Salinicoccus cyprini TaxID=2493691 RepID=A0A558AZD3_9STAP|nr:MULTISPECIES: DUF1033 family protein [Salinicoccus]MCG1009150.1 DUF1033 family protein [Salinicoccus sp. ID82-1]TVT29594.1 DUF1033 family protein [Salinicoccus cyprini]
MLSIVILKADYEGWWLFEGWQDNIIRQYSYDSEKDMREAYAEVKQQMGEKFHSSKDGKYRLTAYFNGCELEYCDDCDEDLQIYYTPMMIKNDELFV